jgi:nitrite reductase/ring-hydroxylating ferredoxin subunit
MENRIPYDLTGDAIDRRGSLEGQSAGSGAATILALQLAVGFRECFRDAPNSFGVSGSTEETWIDVASVDEISNRQAKIVCLPGRERIAVFQHDGNVFAVSNVGAHQRGPLGEGQTIDGCNACPLRGWGCQPHDGQSRPRLTETIATYRVRVESRRVYWHPHDWRASHRLNRLPIDNNRRSLHAAVTDAFARASFSETNLQIFGRNQERGRNRR